MKRASYRHGIEWIALNDEPDCLNAENIRETISVALLSDLFMINENKIALDVIAYRMNYSNTKEKHA